jgi:acetoin utilization deacetylase AcuC-like enzyme
VDGERYRGVLARALRRVRGFDAEVLVVALGLDTARKDPTGTWFLRAADFAANGRMIGELGLPTLVVQEGGYRVRSLGTNARHFFTGLWEGAFGVAAPNPAVPLSFESSNG